MDEGAGAGFGFDLQYAAQGLYLFGDAGQAVASGIYVMRLQVDRWSASRKMILAR